MSPKFVDLWIAAEMIEAGGTLETIISMIQEGLLTAYVRIHCDFDDSDDCDDDDEKYEIARITRMKERQSNHESTKWFNVDYEPISSTNKQDNVLSEANFAFDNYNNKRVFGCLKTKHNHTDIVSTDQICILNTVVARFILGNNVYTLSAGQKLAEIKYNTKERDLLVDKIIKTIHIRLKQVPDDLRVINHLRFIKEANVPKQLEKSVTEKVKLRIKSDFNDSYKPMSRAPKKTEEGYFLLR